MNEVFSNQGLEQRELHFEYLGQVPRRNIASYMNLVETSSDEKTTRAIPYSILFLEVSDAFAKLGIQIPDQSVREVLNIFDGDNENLKDALLSSPLIQNNRELADDIIVRYSNIEENGHLDDLTNKVKDLSEKFSGVLNRKKRGLKSTDFVKLAFASIRISEKSEFDSDFSYIEKLYSYIEKYMGIDIGTLNEKERKQLESIILEGAPKKMLDKMQEAFELEDINIESALGIKNAEEWAECYYHAVQFLTKIFETEDKEGLIVLKETFPGVEMMLVESPIKYYAGSRDMMDSNSHLPFESLGDFLQNVMIENRGCGSKEEWSRFTVAHTLLELTGRSIQVVRNHKAVELLRANQELVEKLLSKKPRNERYEFIQTGNANKIISAELQTRVTLSNGLVVPVEVKIANPKSFDSLLRKAIAKGVAITEIRDKLRAQFFIKNDEVFEDPVLLEEAIARVMHAISTRLGNDIEKGSVKNSFNTGLTNPDSLGDFRCFKYVTKINTSTGIFPFEVMILRRYPDDHRDYEQKKFKSIARRYGLVSYDAMIEELLQELRYKADGSFNDDDIENLKIIEKFILNNDSEVIPENIGRLIAELFIKLNKQNQYTPSSIAILTRLRVLASMAGLEFPSGSEGEDTESLSQ